jgi:hypothetical protein
MMFSRSFHLLIVVVSGLTHAEAFTPHTVSFGTSRGRSPQRTPFRATVEDAVDASKEEKVESTTISTVPDMTSTALEEGIVNATVEEIMPEQLLAEVELEAQKAVDEMMDELEEECDVDEETGGPKDELCVDEKKREGFRQSMRKIVSKTLSVVRSSSETTETASGEEIFEGEILEKGWEKRANAGTFGRNSEIWKVALSCVFKALKPKKMRAKGASEEEIRQAQIEAAEFIRDKLLVLGPSFVKVCFYLLITSMSLAH